MTSLFRGIGNGMGGGMGGSSSSYSKEGIKRTKAVEVIYDEYVERSYDYLYSYNEDYTDTVWYKFKPKADGTFRFYVEDLDGDYTITVYKNKKQIAVGDLNSDMNIELEKGKKYYITVTQSLNNGGDYNYDKYSSYDAYFRFTVGAPIPMGADKDHAYELQLGSNAAQDWASLQPLPDLGGDKKSNKGDTVVGGMDKESGSGEVWFKYTAQSNGQHTFTLTDFTSNSNFDIYEGSNTYTFASQYDSTEIKCYLNQGTTYYIRASLYSSYSDVDTNFGVMIEDEPAGMSKTSAIEIQLGANTEQAFEALEGEGYEVWLKLQPSIVGKYSFAFENDKNAFTPDISVYKAEWIINDWDTKETIYPNNGYYNFSDEKAIYLIKVNTSSYDSFAVNVNALQGTSESSAIQLTLGQSVETYFHRDLYSSNTYFKFTPATSGWYSFNVNGLYNTPTLSVNKGSEVIASPITTNTIACQLTADETYILNVYHNSGSARTFTVQTNTVVGGSSRETAISIQLGDTTAQEWDALNVGSYVWFAFAPTENGRYQISTTSSTSIYVFQNQSTSSMSASGGLYQFTTGNTYYIRISSSYSNFGINISTAPGSSFSNPIVMSRGTRYTANISTGGQKVYFEFTATSNGTYTFYSSGDPDTYGHLYNSSRSEITSNDDGAGSGDFSMSYSMDAGETVYLVARLYNSSNTGYFYVYVS